MSFLYSSHKRGRSLIHSPYIGIKVDLKLVAANEFGMTIRIRGRGEEVAIHRKNSKKGKVVGESPLLPPMSPKITCHPEFRQIGACGGLEE